MENTNREVKRANLTTFLCSFKKFLHQPNLEWITWNPMEELFFEPYLPQYIHPLFWKSNDNNWLPVGFGERVPEAFLFGLTCYTYVPNLIHVHENNLWGLMMNKVSGVLGHVQVIKHKSLSPKKREITFEIGCLTAKEMRATWRDNWGKARKKIKFLTFLSKFWGKKKSQKHICFYFSEFWKIKLEWIWKFFD